MTTSGKNEKAAPLPNQKAVQLLQELAKQLARLPASDIEAVISGAARIRVVVEDTKAGQKRASDSIADSELVALVEEMRQCKTRQAAISALERVGSTKTILARVSRLLDLPVQKTSSAEMMAEKVIEATVGFRLRSAAVEGRNDASNNAIQPTGEDASG
ncbi:MAG: hypothetical protein GKR94_13645 [Gammaproteobacteria bacterium]|nr:hypothetical protein [Gammaproteobacteria bacterium]